MTIHDARNLNLGIWELPASRFTNGQGGGAIIEGSYQVYKDLMFGMYDDGCSEGYIVPWCPMTWGHAKIR